MNKRTRLFYAKDATNVIIVKDGLEVAAYQSASEMVETHIKGLLARDQQDAKSVKDLMSAYRPNDVMRR